MAEKKQWHETLHDQFGQYTPNASADKKITCLA